MNIRETSISYAKNNREHENKLNNDLKSVESNLNDSNTKQWYASAIKALKQINNERAKGVQIRI